MTDGMRAACIASSFGLSDLAVRDVPRPAPGPGEVLIRVSAASLNHRDVRVAEGTYNPSYPLPLILGSDAAGVVVELGPGAAEAGVALGARVCPLFAQGWLDGAPTRKTTRHTLGGPLPGVFAEFVVARADSVVEIPEFFDDVEAATLPCAAVTAWSALETLGGLRAGERVLTQGSGGVSLFALQIARLGGAEVIATTSSPEKRERLTALGAAHVVDARAPRWGDAVRKLSGGEGVDHVIEIGGAGTLAESLGAVRPGGSIHLIGVLGGASGYPSLLPAVMRNVRLQGVFVGHARSFHALVAGLVRGAARPVIDSVFPLERVRDAFDHVASGRQFGKVCLRVSS